MNTAKGEKSSSKISDNTVGIFLELQRAANTKQSRK
jgi:hypothetical protein